MSDVTVATQSPKAMSKAETLAEAFVGFQQVLDAMPRNGRVIAYNWWSLPESMDMRWLEYTQMLQEYARELANAINMMMANANRIRAWSIVTSDMSDQQKLDISHEFVENLGVVSLGQPYAIKSRFAFAAGMLSHFANRSVDGADWIDDFPDKNLYLNDIEPYCVQWKKYRKLKLRIEEIANRSFKEDTDDFRNSYNHGFPSRFLIGQVTTIKRHVSLGNKVYRVAIGAKDPLDLEHLANILDAECAKCRKAFAAFQALVGEHIDVLTRAQNGDPITSGGHK